MKRITTYSLIAFAIMAFFVACAKEQDAKSDFLNGGKEIETIGDNAEYAYTFRIGSEDSDTKSNFTVANKYVSWDASKDKLGVYSVNSSSQVSYNQQCAVVTSPSLSFTLKSKNALADGDAIYAYYPYNYINTSTSAYHNPNNVHLEIKSEQAQDGTTFNSSAMPMVAKYAVTDDIEADTDTPVATLPFANLAGILDFKVYSSNATYRSESVISVTFKANSAICGEFNYNAAGLDYETASTMTISGYVGTSITTTVTNPVALTGAKETAYDVCMAVAPGSYTGVVEVITDKAIYTYNVSSSKTVGRSQILSLGVDLGSGSRYSINPADYSWSLVKDVKELAAGDWVIIAGSAYDVAMGTTQSDNYRPTVAIEKSVDALTATATTQIFEVANGSVDNTLAFKAVNGVTRSRFLYAASTSSNWLRSQASVDANASWLVTVTGAGVASLVAQGTNTKNTMQYNTSGWISAYGSASQKALALYILDVPSEIKLRPSTISVNFLSTDNSSVEKDVDFYIKNVSTWNVENSNTTDFTVDDDVLDARNGLVTIAPNAVNNTYSNKTANVTVSASGADNVVITVTQAAKVAVCTLSTATTTIPATISDYYTITVNANVPWTAAVTAGDNYVEDFEVTGNTTSAPASTDGTVTIEFKDNGGAARDITFTITPDEVGSGLSAQTITFTQSSGVLAPLEAPTAVTISSLSTRAISASWTSDDSSFTWILSEEADPADAEVSYESTGTVSAKTLSVNGLTLTDGATYYLHVKANGNNTTTSDSDYATSVGTEAEYVATWNLVSNVSGLKAGTYAIAALNSSKYYTVPKTTISGQTFTCTEATYDEGDGLTLPSSAGQFTFTAVAGKTNAYYIYNTNLEKYLVATGSKTFGYVTSSSSDYGYWTFSNVASGGVSGLFSVQHSSKSHYMRAYSNSVRCYDSTTNQGVYLFVYE